MEKFKNKLTQEDADRGFILVDSEPTYLAFVIYSGTNIVAQIKPEDSNGWNILNPSLDMIHVATQNEVYYVKDGYRITAISKSEYLDGDVEDVLVYDSDKHADGVKQVKVKEKVSNCPMCYDIVLRSELVDVCDALGIFYKRVCEDCVEDCINELAPNYRPQL